MSTLNEHFEFRLTTSKMDTLFDVKNAFITKKYLSNTIGHLHDTLSFALYTENKNSPCWLNYVYIAGFEKMLFGGQQRHFYFTDFSQAQNHICGEITVTTNSFPRLWHIQSLHEVNQLPIQKFGVSLAIFYWDGALYDQTLVAFNQQSLLQPSFDGFVDNQDLAGLPPANYVILCLPAFVEQAQELADHRHQHGARDRRQRHRDHGRDPRGGGLPGQQALRALHQH